MTRSSLLLCFVILLFLSPSVQGGSEEIVGLGSLSIQIDGPGSLSYSIDVIGGKESGFIDIFLVDERNYERFLDGKIITYEVGASFQIVTHGSIREFDIEDKRYYLIVRNRNLVTPLTVTYDVGITRPSGSWIWDTVKPVLIILGIVFAGIICVSIYRSHCKKKPVNYAQLRATTPPTVELQEV